MLHIIPSYQFGRMGIFPCIIFENQKIGQPIYKTSCILPTQIIIAYTIPEIREQMFGPDLHVFTLKFLALKTLFFFSISGYFGVFRGIFFFCIMQFFSGDAILFSKRFKKEFRHRKSKKQGHKSYR
jgi:hypothetical protein